MPLAPQTSDDGTSRGHRGALMASVSSAHLVLFIAAVLFSAALAGTLTEGATSLADSIDGAADADADHANAEFRIVSDDQTPTAVYDAGNETLTLLVKNTGARTLPDDPGDVTVLVNGAYQADTQTTVLDADTWRPSDVLRVRANVSLGSNAKTRVVVDAGGHRDRFVFTTP
ncbi:flagellin [Halobacterium jilantaiense]|uniref:Flagellar protein FlaG n=1 Tax=Halobacterium jilantaiense TaxID=355548 RepID=A0A1I0PF59_9EURY|nr:flagellin [Halobacterium jilantaiense]SEW12884.1 flagellar protein FlaG [Halobacterium jilantaiense]